MTCIGQRSREVYYNFTFDDPADAMKYKTVIEKFDSHFCTKSNITFLRFKFFNVKQQENQPVDDFINELRTKAQECEFLELTESLIRDRIVCGINNLKLQERLLREPDLTLDRAILLCKADEDTIKQTTEIQKHTGTAESKVDAIKTKYKGKKQFTKSKPTYQVKASVLHMAKYVLPAANEIILLLCVCLLNKLNQCVLKIPATPQIMKIISFSMVQLK